MTDDRTTPNGASRSMSISCSGTDVADYHFRPDHPTHESPRPFLDEMRTLGGIVVSESRPDDHPWHRGLSWALPVVGEHSFWGGPSYRAGAGYVQLPNNGSQRHERFLTGERTARRSDHLVEDLTWTSQGGQHLVEERRSMSAEVIADDAWVLTFTTAMTNVTPHALALGSPTTHGRPDAGYGGLFWRGAPRFLGGLVISPHGTGGDDMRGSRSPWMGISADARHDDDGATVVIADGPDNLRTPPQWFARSEDYPGLCPAPFFSEEHGLEPGVPLRFTYAVVVADGASTPERGAALAHAGLAALAARSADPE